MAMKILYFKIFGEKFKIQPLVTTLHQLGDLQDIMKATDKKDFQQIVWIIEKCQG